MIKIFLGIIGVLALIGIFASTNSDPVDVNAPWVILALCLGFIGVIEAIEKLGEKK